MSFCIPLLTSLFGQACPFLFLPLIRGICSSRCAGVEVGREQGVMFRGFRLELGTEALILTVWGWTQVTAVSGVSLAPKEYFWVNGMCEHFLRSQPGQSPILNNTRMLKGEDRVDAVVVQG